MSLLWIREQLNRAAEPANKNFATVDLIHQQYLKRDYLKKSGISSLQRRSLGVFPILMKFRVHSPLFKMVRDLSFRMMDAGILPIELPEFFENYKEGEPEDIGPQVLTMDHLGIGFLACLVPLTMSCVAFLGEVLIGWYFRRILRRKMKKITVQSISAV